MADLIQQQLIAARRGQILDAAAAVFAEKGFHATTIRDIAQRAGVADGTIYNYFESKPALLLGIFERMKAAVVAAHPPPAPGAVDLPTFIRTFYHQPLLALKQDNFALFRIIVAESLVNDELRTLYQQQILAPALATAEDYLQQHAAEAGLSPGETALTARALSAMALGLALQAMLGDTGLDAHWEQLPGVLSELVLNGLNAKAEQ